MGEMLRKCEYAVKKVTKKADKKMSGFLKKAQEDGDGGLFDDSLRPSEESKTKPSKPSEPIKMSDGLWVVPTEKEEDDSKGAGTNEEEVDYDRLALELAEIKDSNPEQYKEMRDKVKAMIEQNVEDGDGQDMHARVKAIAEANLVDDELPARTEN